MTTNDPLTPKQAEVFIEIKRYHQERECSPSIRDLARILGKSKGAIQFHLVSLEEKGRIKRVGHFGISIL